jgi:hypothetical protein
MTTLVRKQLLLDLVPPDGADRQLLYEAEREEDVDADADPITLVLDVLDWYDMGQPAKLTVTIEIGDTLNDG